MNKVIKVLLSEWATILLFLVCWIAYKDWKLALRLTLFVVGMYYFNFAICIYYKDLKNNQFNFKVAASKKSWIYFGIIVGGVITLFLIFLPNFMLLMAGVISGLLLIALFIYDLITDGIRRQCRTKRRKNAKKSEA